MRALITLSGVTLSGFVALLILGGCGGPSASSGASSAAPASCERTCDAAYDACTDRFAAVSPGGGLGGTTDTGNTSLGPNRVCSDQLKSCQRSCLN
jgi:hypothetical protein